MQPKRIIVMLLVVILAMCSAVTVVAADAPATLDMAVEVSSSTALSDNALFLLEEGAIVNVSVTITANPGFSLLGFELKYNPSVLKPILKSDETLDWKKGTVVTDAIETVVIKEKSATEGVVKYTAYKSGVDFTATGAIFSCKFEVIGHGSSPVTLVMDGKDFTNKNNDLFPVEAVTTKVNGAEGNSRVVLVHEYNSTSTTHHPATCTEPGKTVYKCILCNDARTVIEEDEPAKGHTNQTLPSVTPTCRVPGKTEGIQCSVCQTIVTQQFDIPAGDAYHVKEIDAAVAPTCQADGLTEGAHCSVCEAVLTEQTVVPKLDDHVYGDWVEHEDGTRTKTCIHCGDKQVEATTTGYIFLILIIVIAVLATLLIAGIVVVVVILVKKKKVV